MNDDEGIAGLAAYRADRALLHRLTLAGPARRCRTLELLPFRRYRFRLTTPAPEDVAGLRRRMDRDCRRFGGRVVGRHDDTLELFWN